MKLVHGLALIPFVALVGFVHDTPIDRHVAAMQAATSATIKFKVFTVGGGEEEQELTLSRPNLLKWESPKKLVVSDGHTATVFDKEKKTYTQSPVTEDWTKKSLNDDVVWAWGAFFNKDFAEKGVKGFAKGPQGTVHGVKVTRYTVERENRKPIVVLVDAEGLVRGGMFDSKAGDQVVVQSDKFTLATKAVDAGSFAFSAPADAKEVKPDDPAKMLTYADVSDIFNKQCGGCHGSNNPKAGISLNSYQGIMSSGGVTAGDPDNSNVINVIRKGQMPPRRKMDMDMLAKLEKWVKDGAKE